MSAPVLSMLQFLLRFSSRGGRLSQPLAGYAVLFVIIPVLFCPTVTAKPERAVLDRSIGVGTYPIRIFFTEKSKKVAWRIESICEEAIPSLAEEIGIEEVSAFQIQVISDLKPYLGDSQNDLPRWGVAFAFMESQLMLVDAKRASKAWNSLEKVIPHELSHILLAQRVGSVQMPLWFIEGLAQWQAGQWSILESWRLMEAVWTRKAPPLGRITNSYPRDESGARDAYRISYAAFTFRFGDEFERLPHFLTALKEHGDFYEAFTTYWNEDVGTFYLRFHKAMQDRYSSKLLIFQTGPLFAIVAVVFLFIFLRVKLRNRRKLKKMEKSELGLTFDDD